MSNCDDRRPHTRFRRGLRAVVWLAMTLALMACSANPRQISGEDPVLTLDGMAIQDSQLRVSIRLSNVNDSAQSLDQLNLELGLDGAPPLRSLGAGQSLTIAARGREQLTFRFVLNQSTRGNLLRLSEGEVERLPWRMMLVRGTSSRVTIGEGWIYAVPGQAERFR
ncbi:MAG: hypothetical protein AAGJ52_01610 [Pseudomonadota bacterium]